MTGLAASRPDVIAYRLVPRSAGLLGSALLVVVGVAVIAAAAQVRIPLPFTPVPLSGQTFAVLLVGAGVGAHLGVVATAAYVALGAIGLPIYTGAGAGVEHLSGPTGGYLVGFIAAAYLAGAMAERRYDRRVLSALVGMLMASVVIYVLGASWLVASLGMDVSTAVQQGIAPFVIGDVIKAALAAGLLPAAWSVVGRPSTAD